MSTFPPAGPPSPPADPAPPADPPAAWSLGGPGWRLAGAPGEARVVGVLNVTPDSFSDGGRYASVGAAVDRAAEMLAEGAALLDVGGVSTRPAGAAYGAGAAAVSEAEELDRVLPAVEAILASLPDAVLSVDTTREAVARAALATGARVVNDVSGLREGAGVARACAEAQAPLVVMHARGRIGAHAHEVPAARGDVLDEVEASLRASLDAARAAGVREVVLDAGFGFGKTPAENLRLVAHTARLAALGCPVMVGVSRKHTLGIILGTPEAPAPVGARLHAGLALAAVGAWGGAALVRTHDVRETAELLRTLAATAAAAR